MRRLRNIFRGWLPFAVVVTAFCALAYATVQQSLRQAANDPQIQMAEDTAASLNAGAGPENVLPKEKVEFSKSLAPFVVLYDSSGKPIGSSGVLDGAMPEYPLGALQAAKDQGENRVTWQPRGDVRVASVAVPYKDGFVVAGRNLREVEKRESQTQWYAAGIWVVTLMAVFAALVFGEYVLNPGKDTG